MKIVPNITIGFEYPVEKTFRGIIYINNIEFANIWRNGPNHIPANKWIINRSSLALELEYPVEQCHFDTKENLIDGIKNWFIDNEKCQIWVAILESMKKNII